MKILLHADYRGVLTGERFYTAGEHEVADDIGAALINAGRASIVAEPEPEPEPAPKRKRRTRKKADATDKT